MQVRLYHWRDKDDEVDLIYDHPDGPLAFEVGSGGGHHRAGLYALMERYPRFRGRCFIVTPDIAPAGDRKSARSTRSGASRWTCSCWP